MYYLLYDCIKWLKFGLITNKLMGKQMFKQIIKIVYLYCLWVFLVIEI